MTILSNLGNRKNLYVCELNMKKIFLGCLLSVSISLFAQLPQNLNDYTKLILSQNTGLKSEDLAEMKISSQSTDNKNGVTHIYINQYYKNLSIHNAVLGLHLNKESKIVALNSTFFKNLGIVSATSNPAISANEAAIFALNEKNKGSIISTSTNSLEKTSSTQFESTFKNAELAQGDIKVKLKWVSVNATLKLVWNVNWITKDEQNWWNLRIDAITGKLADENNWITECHPTNLSNTENHSTNLITPGTGEGSGEGKSSAKYKVLARPVESPSHGNMVLLNDPSDSLSSPFSWHDDNAAIGAEYTITRGNNAYAYEDKDNNNQAGYSPNGGSSLNFDFAFDKTKKHTDYLDAAITNLFYWNNLMHDVWYHYGFDDESGNFQVNNYGRGGAGSDEVNAEAQDGSGTNNANFGTPPDGQNPRMQMFVWNVSSLSSLLRVNQPTNIAKQYSAALAGFGPKLTTTPILGNLVLVSDGTANPSLGCNALTNGSSIKGQIALIDRGTCTFLDKVQFAQNAGAKAVIMVNNVNGNPITMGGSGGVGITIPSIMITKADGDILKNALKSATVKVSLYDSAGALAKQYDSDFDNGVICHEYGHGISNRLTGGPDNTDCLSNEEQMGEGWSDFFGLVLTHKNGDKGTDKRGIGTYVIDEQNDGDGIRNYPYSTSLSINPVTYKDIKTFSVPHGVGSVWCSMLWDIYWDLITKHGYDADIYNGKGGNNIAMKLVIDGMKLQPCNPGFEDGRDAILLADELNNKSANQDIIWKAFARRGLGFGASQGSNDDRGDGTESFSVPKFDLPIITKTAVSETKNGDTLVYKIVLKNNNAQTIKQLTFRDTLKTDLKFIKASGFLKGTFASPIYKATIDSLKSGDSLVAYIYTKANSATYSTFIETTDFEAGPGQWKDSTLEGVGAWASRTNKKYKGARSYFIANASTKSDKILMKSFDLKSLTKPSLIFYHLYITESDWDGAVVEINKNGTWEDLGPNMTDNGYNNVISVNPESNISGQDAFSGNSNQFIKTIIDLSPYKNETVKIRFRMVSDGAQGAEGWYIDDISLVDNLVSINNNAFIQASNGSSSSSLASTLILKGPNVSVTSPELVGFNISPNPFNEQIIVSSTNTNYRLTITDITGKIVLKNNDAKNTTVIETQMLSHGTYFLKLETANGTDVIKLVK